MKQGLTKIWKRKEYNDVQEWEKISSHDGKNHEYKVNIPTKQVYVLSQKYHDGLNIDDDLAKVKDKSVASEIVEVDQCTEDGFHMENQA